MAIREGKRFEITLDRRFQPNSTEFDTFQTAGERPAGRPKNPVTAFSKLYLPGFQPLALARANN
jgi:hypothetical protein